MTTYFTIGSGKDYSTIQSAIDAIPAVLNDAYELVIYDGTYAEALTIEKTTSALNTIKIRSAYQNDSVILSSGTSISITIRSSYVTIEDFRINVGAAFSAIYIPVETYNITINRMFIAGVGSSTLYGFESENIAGSNHNHVISNSIITNVRRGIRTVTAETKILNNTIYVDSLYSASTIWSNAPTLEVRNNICWNNVTTETQYSIVGINDITSFTASDNIWYFPNMSNPFGWQYNINYYATYSSYASASGETSGSYANPLLTNPGSDDFTLQSGSPARDTGYNTGLPLDWAGNGRPVNTTYDVGALEYGGVNAELPDDFGGSPSGGPLLCWQLTARYKGTGRLFQLNGSGPHPIDFKLPAYVDLESVSLIDEGNLIPKTNYKLI